MNNTDFTDNLIFEDNLVKVNRVLVAVLGLSLFKG